MSWWTNRKLNAALRKNDAAAVADLIEKGADPYSSSSDETVLMWSVENGHADLARMLLERGANVNDEDQTGRTVLIAAADKGHTDIAQFLISKGAKVNSLVDGKTALITAAQRGHKEIALSLLDGSADTSVKDSDGWTALQWATSKEHTDIAQCLRDRGAVE